MSQDISLNLLAIVFYRERRYADALALLERAYKQTVAFHAPAPVVKQIVDNGRAVSISIGDDAAIEVWSQRSATLN